ncbi:SusC/RagA family TonB-linked outer membrane protein [Lunatibacter salilacus]|uniref:SusC/RagA family TonB-linked outer membrane protein n=1 Tax=Lunatibacter salilacus TaxID=2483804 RepID=UPI00131BC12A|nr:TonB-dependent receptor [Lunatibacter salilacus]
MKKTLHALCMVGKYYLYGFVFQLFFLQMIQADPTKAQGSMDMKEVLLTLNLENASLSEAFDQINVHSGFSFIIDDRLLARTVPVNMTIQNQSLEDVLYTLAANHGLAFKQVNYKISVKASNRRGNEPPIVVDITVTGRVVDENEEPIPGVTVSVPGTSLGTATDIDGNYSITVPEGSALIFSFIGYESQRVTIGDQSIINISLSEDVSSLQEVVVVGYGTQKKSDLTGAIVSIGSETLNERPITNVAQALQGNAAGVHVTTNMRPGELPAVRIRGNRSINASNDPLYVVDGIPIVTQLGVNSFSLNDINPNDIQSIEILKDASATAIYGSRGANGVILVTTKKGQKGRVTVDYNATVSFDSYRNLTDWMNGGQYVDIWRESLINGRLYGDASNQDLNTQAQSWYPDPFLDQQVMGLGQDTRARDGVWAGYEWDEFGVTPRLRPTTAEEQAMGWPAQVPIYNAGNVRDHDWQRDVTRQGVTNIHQVSLSAGTDRSRLYLSLGYFNQKGVQRDQDFERFTLNLNGDINPTNWLTIGTSVLGSFSTQNFGFMGPNTSNTGAKDLFSRANNQFPYALPRDENGSFIANPGGNLNLWNPLMDIENALNERRSSSLMSNMFAEVAFTPWLKYRLNFGGQIRNFRNGSWTGPGSSNHLNLRPNTAGMSRDENFSWVNENLIFIDKTIAEKHVIGVTLLYSTQYSRREGMNIGVSNTIVPASRWYDLNSNANGRPDSYGTSFTENTLSSYMARINYSFNDKYLLTASGRYDGASVLAPGYKWDFFPSFSAAWKMQEEPFLRDVTWLNELKPRLGFGVTGNSSVNPYTTTGPLSRNPYVFGGQAAFGFLPQLVQNPNLGWEKTGQWNAGLDFGVLEGRIQGSLEVYDMTTTGLIFGRSLPAVTGYVQKFENIGSTRNRGLELSLSTVNMERPDFSWQTDFNFGANREEIMELVNGKEDMIANNLFIGHPIHSFFDYEQAGIWQNTPEDLEAMSNFNENGHRFYPGTVKVVDQNGDFRIDSDDRVVVGSRQPRWTGGITNTFRYKNWTLSSMAYARIGQTYMGGYPHYGGIWPNGRAETDFWRWDNAGGRWPLPIQGANVENITTATQFNDGSFVAIRHISLAYDFPQALIEQFRMSNFQINVQVVNPFLFGGDIVRLGINPDDDTSWENRNAAGDPLGGMNSNTILPQSFVISLRAGF